MFIGKKFTTRNYRKYCHKTVKSEGNVSGFASLCSQVIQETVTRLLVLKRTGATNSPMTYGDKTQQTRCLSTKNTI